MSIDHGKVLALLKIAVCPNKENGCDGEQYPVGDPAGDFHGEQCQWCAERREAMAAEIDRLAEAADGESIESPQSHAYYNAVRALAQPAEASRPDPSDCSHYFPLEPRRCVRCGWDFRNGDPAQPAEAVEGADGDSEHAEEVAKILANRGFHAAAATVIRLVKKHDAAQGAAAIPPEAVEIEGTALLAGCAQIGDWAIPTKCGARIVDARMAYGWNQCREAMLESDTRPQAATAQGDGVGLIAAERRRQVEAEGWTPEHDDVHTDGSLAVAAACYATQANQGLYENGNKARDAMLRYWPWDAKWWKPTPQNRIRELVKAGALIAAEIDRLQRAAAPSQEGGS